MGLRLTKTSARCVGEQHYLCTTNAMFQPILEICTQQMQCSVFVRAHCTSRSCQKHCRCSRNACMCRRVEMCASFKLTRAQIKCMHNPSCNIQQQPIIKTLRCIFNKTDHWFSISTHLSLCMCLVRTLSIKLTARSSSKIAYSTRFPCVLLIKSNMHNPIWVLFDLYIIQMNQVQ